MRSEAPTAAARLATEGIAMNAQTLSRVTDNDRDEITVTLDGKELRGWSYATEAERRMEIVVAREFVEGWAEAAGRIALAKAEGGAQ